MLNSIEEDEKQLNMFPFPKYSSIFRNVILSNPTDIRFVLNIY